MKKKYTSPSYTLTVIESCLLHLEFKKDKMLSAVDVNKLFTIYKKNLKRKKLFMMITFKGFLPLSDEAMARAVNKRIAKMHAASAFVIKRNFHRMGMDFFLNFYKPSYPIRIFSTNTAALAWLRKQKRLEGCND